MQLELIDCHCSYKAAGVGLAPALRGLNLQIAHGEQLAVIGPSGAGKTTLLHLLACALPPETGTLHIGGDAPWQLPALAKKRLRGRLFLAPQVPPLPPRQRVVTAVLAGRLPQMSLWASLRSLVYPQGIEIAHDALAQFDLADKLFERVDRLSGGERQRVGLARLLVSNAELLLVDEPLSALDPERSRQAMLTLTHTARLRNATLVTTMHHVEMALLHFPRIVALRDGELVFDLPAKQITSELLHDLYANHLDELAGPAQAIDAVTAHIDPVVMQCH
ncbi:MAG TPA: ATP-binding cassette domain-containing protein [Burkholderiaceae bacterium]|jgi:phosphonate transport system ATP-binding protein|nr:ATP-binding cassette domain-containing protein [Burkholderiaceae bacterium]